MKKKKISSKLIAESGLLKEDMQINWQSKRLCISQSWMNISTAELIFLVRLGAGSGVQVWTPKEGLFFLAYLLPRPFTIISPQQTTDSESANTDAEYRRGTRTDEQIAHQVSENTNAVCNNALISVFSQPCSQIFSCRERLQGMHG